jgi:hypothetical protein
MSRYDRDSRLNDATVGANSSEKGPRKGRTSRMTKIWTRMRLGYCCYVSSSLADRQTLSNATQAVQCWPCWSHRLSYCLELPQAVALPPPWEQRKCNWRRYRPDFDHSAIVREAPASGPPAGIAGASQ